MTGLDGDVHDDQEGDGVSYSAAMIQACMHTEILSEKAVEHLSNEV
jgi:hypothetical protein